MQQHQKRVAGEAGVAVPAELQQQDWLCTVLTAGVVVLAAGVVAALVGVGEGAAAGAVVQQQQVEPCARNGAAWGTVMRMRPMMQTGVRPHAHCFDYRPSAVQGVFLTF